MPPKGQLRTCELLPGSSENIRRTATNPVERYEHGFVFCYVQLSAMDAPASMADLFWDSMALESLRKMEDDPYEKNHCTASVHDDGAEHGRLRQLRRIVCCIPVCTCIHRCFRRRGRRL